MKWAFARDALRDVSVARSVIIGSRVNPLKMAVSPCATTARDTPPIPPAGARPYGRRRVHQREAKPLGERLSSSWLYAPPPRACATYSDASRAGVPTLDPTPVYRYVRFGRDLLSVKASSYKRPLAFSCSAVRGRALPALSRSIRLISVSTSSACRRLTLK
jgi:hypothetical protein